MNAPLDSFETALLSRLRDQVQEPTAASHRIRRSRLLLAAAATVAAAAAMVVVVPGLGSTAAYSVQEGNSGTITVEVRRLEDAEGLEAALAEYGVNADITYVPNGRTCAPGRYTPVYRKLSGMELEVGRERLKVTLPPGAVRVGETFVLSVSGKVMSASSAPSVAGETVSDVFNSTTDFDVTAGPVQPCRVIPNTTE